MMSRAEAINAKLDHAETLLILAGWPHGWRCTSVSPSPKSCSRYLSFKHPSKGKLSVRVSSHTDPVPSARKVPRIDVIPLVPGSLNCALQYLRSYP